MKKVLERWAVVGDGTFESRRLIPMKDDGRDPVELYDALQKADEFLNEINAIMGRIEPRLEIVDVGVILMSTQLEQADERIAELEVVAGTIIAKCEKPENRGRMTQKQQASFLDGLRSETLAALGK